LTHRNDVVTFCVQVIMRSTNHGSRLPAACLCACAALLAMTGVAAPPLALATALEHLRDQKSYSWEVINADPGPVAQRFETRRGTVTTIQQNLSPNIKGSIDRNGDMLIEREWADGLRLVTIITKDGAVVTNTPEGWMNEREILTAQADERVRGGTNSRRAVWLRRADRPDVRRPDQELAPFLNTRSKFEVVGDTYIARGRLRSDGTAATDEDDPQSAVHVTVAMTARGGIIRDYEVKVEATRRVTRARLQVPYSDQRIVIITYLPVRSIDIPEEARAKLDALRAPGRGSSIK
jgi:hypothetical protein